MRLDNMVNTDKLSKAGIAVEKRRGREEEIRIIVATEKKSKKGMVHRSP